MGIRLMTRTILASLAILFIALGQPAIAGTITPGIFELFNHPDGLISGTHGPYGLRLDDDEPPVGNGPTFDVEADSNPVTLTWNLDGTAVIEGRLLNNTTNEYWEVVYNLTGVTSASGGFSADAASGTLTYDDVGVAPPSSPISLTGKQASGSVFNLFPDGHRLDNDNMSPVGRGWIVGDGNYNDWLVVAVQTTIFNIPEPTSVALVLCGALALCHLRRRS